MPVTVCFRQLQAGPRHRDAVKHTVIHTVHTLAELADHVLHKFPRVLHAMKL